MISKLLMPFLLIYILLGCQIACANHRRVAPQDNITRPATELVITRGNLRGFIRGILNRKKSEGKILPPEMLEEQYVPPGIEFYLDPPEIPLSDQSRLA